MNDKFQKDSSSIPGSNCKIKASDSVEIIAWKNLGSEFPSLRLAGLLLGLSTLTRVHRTCHYSQNWGMCQSGAIVETNLFTIEIEIERK